MLSVLLLAVLCISAAYALSPQPEPPRFRNQDIIGHKGLPRQNLPMPKFKADRTPQLGTPGTADREGGFFAACGAGTKFKAVDCDSWSQAPDLQPDGRGSETGVCDTNYIECGADDRGEGQKREIYHWEIQTVNGKRQQASNGDVGYYAQAKNSEDRGVKPHQRFCWKRWGAGGDGCGCLCAVVLQGSALGKRPECRCYP
jgi:hypothetical protein